MFYIFEMANNHQGSINHAKKIIDAFALVAHKKNLNAAIKFQFRQLDSFVHEDYKKSDLKFVKRFNSTRLEKYQFAELIDYVKKSGLCAVATPFDNASLPWLKDLKVDVVKIASCSVDDWVLLKEVALINKKIVISTGGATLKHLKKVYKLFKKHHRDFAFMHCVGEYPTPHTAANLARITRLQEEFSDIEIGFSTHESPLEKSLAPYAVALGCTIVEKHVGVETSEIKLNAYSNTPEQIEKVIDEINYFQASLDSESQTQVLDLKKLKRGVYLKNDISTGHQLTLDDLYFAMPVMPGQADASMADDEWGWVKREINIVNKKTCKDLKANAPVMIEDLEHEFIPPAIFTQLKTQAENLLEKARVTITPDDSVEISCHYGIENFFQMGALIIDKINREYCKKIIILLEGQAHPSHHHIIKEEVFELLYGDCSIELNGHRIQLELGKPVLIPRKVKHSFQSINGCVIEEVSTTHIKGDSVYQDPQINELELCDRKIKFTLKEKNES